MSLVTNLVCVNCGGSYADGACFTCPKCGPDEGILDVRYDFDRAAETLKRSSLELRACSHWRYHELLPLELESCSVECTIGWTPMTEAPRLADALGVARLRLKDDGRNPSGSFKDRASSVGVAHALQTGYREIACASTGNAASSLAHCAAAAGLRANIFVSDRIPEGKLAQLLAYGARVFRVGGSYADAYELCTRACERFGWYNRNCAVNPYLVEGKKTGGLEIAEQCADDPPDWVVCSVGDGCSIAGVHKGLAEMKRLGVIAWSAQMLGVQAAGVAPIAESFGLGASGRRGATERAAGFSPRGHASEKRTTARGQSRGSSSEEGAVLEHDTYADSINVPVPRNRRKALDAVRRSEGAFVTVTDEQIMRAVRDAGRLAGVFAEPAAAAAVAGIAEARERNIIDERSSVVALITGNGLKDIAGALRAVGEPHDIAPDFDRVIGIVETET